MAVNRLVLKTIERATMYRERETVVGATNANTVTVEHVESGSTYSTNYYGTQTRKGVFDYVDANSYYLLKRCGELLPSHPFKVDTRTVTIVPGPVNAQLTSGSTATYEGQDSQYALVHGDRPNFLPLRELEDGWLDAVILSSQKKAVQDRWDLLTALAELKETVGTLTGIVRRFNGTTKDIAQRAVRFARRVRRNPVKVFDEMWLEARYGIRPILFDASEAGKALARLGQGKRAWVIGKDFSVKSVADTSFLPWSDGDVNWEYPWTQVRLGDYTLRGWSSCTFDSLFASTFQMDPIVTGYELVPYSFVVDWFVDVGGYLSTLTPLLTGDLNSSVSVKLDTSYTSILNAVVKPGRGSGVWSYGSWKEEIKSYHRMPGSGNLPGINPNMSLPKYIDLAALARVGQRDVTRVLTNGLRRFSR